MILDATIISTHALMEGDPKKIRMTMKLKYFNSRPHGGRHVTLVDPSRYRRISTHALTEGDIRGNTNNSGRVISTHALTEGDTAGDTPSHTAECISTHALTEGDNVRLFTSAESSISTHALTEGDTIGAVFCASQALFQLTPSRRATSPRFADRSAVIFQLTPSRRATKILRRFFISHAFQLTPSRRATAYTGITSTMFGISTHALTEGDRR